VGLVADAHEQREADVVPRQLQLAAVGEDDRLLTLGEADERRRGEAMLLEGREGGADLAEAAVDDDELGERPVLLVQARVTSSDHFLHRAEVVVALEGLDLEAAVARLVGLAVDEADHRRDGERAGDVRDVEALRRGRRSFEAEGGGERGEGAGLVAAGEGVLAEEAA